MNIENFRANKYNTEILPVVKRLREYVAKIDPIFKNHCKTLKDNQLAMRIEKNNNHTSNFSYFVLIFFGNLVKDAKTGRLLIIPEITFYTSRNIHEKSNRFELKKYITDYRIILTKSNIFTHEDGNRYDKLGLKNELLLFNSYVRAQDPNEKEWYDLHNFLDVLHQKKIIEFKESESLISGDFIKRIKDEGIRSCPDFTSVLLYIKVTLNGYLTEEIAKQRETMFILAREHKQITSVVQNKYPNAELKLKGGNCYKLNVEKLHNASPAEKQTFMKNLRSRGINIDSKQIESFMKREYEQNVLSDWDFSVYNNVNCDPLAMPASRYGRIYPSTLRDLEKAWISNEILNENIKNNVLEKAYYEYIKINALIKEELHSFIVNYEKLFESKSDQILNLYNFINNANSGTIFEKNAVSDVKIYYHSLEYNTPLDRSKFLFTQRDSKAWHKHFNNCAQYFELSSVKNNTNVKIVDMEVYGHRDDNTISGFDLVRLELVFNYRMQLNQVTQIIIPVFAELLDYSCSKPLTIHGAINYDPCDYELLNFEHQNQLVTFKSMSLKLFIDDIFYMGTTLKSKLKKRLLRLCNVLFILLGKERLSSDPDCRDSIVGYLRTHNHYCQKNTAQCILELLEEQNISKNDNEFADIIKQYVRKHKVGGNNSILTIPYVINCIILTILITLLIIIIIMIIYIMIPIQMPFVHQIDQTPMYNA